MTARSHRKWRRAAAVLAIGGSLLLVNVGPAVGARFSVKATNQDTWDPKVRRIEKEDKVIWRNPTEKFHDVKSYGGNWNFYETLDGQTASKRFNRRGTFKYRCTIHSDMEDGVCSDMCGKIRVVRPD